MKTNLLLEERPQELLQILKYQFNCYWSTVDYSPSTLDLFQISPSLFSVWLLQRDASELWPRQNKKDLLPGVTKSDAELFEELLEDDEMNCRRLLRVIEQAWSLITVPPSSPVGVRVLKTEVRFSLYLHKEGEDSVQEACIVTGLNAEEYGMLREPDLLHIWSQALREAAQQLLTHQVAGLLKTGSTVLYEGNRDMVPQSPPVVTRTPGQDPFQFQMQTRSDPADEELALELRALLERVAKQDAEIEALKKQVAALPNAGTGMP